ncbi:MAG TPA: hypothetical protein DD490_24100 [Acidobacteria bacterium]|nr:hypothetical protein [Acidobacteriota bacterium]
MLRLLVLVLLAYLVYLGLENLLGKLRNATGGGPLPPPAPPPRVTATVHREAVEELVPCARCGVRVPRSRLLARPGGEMVCGACGDRG